MSDLMTGMNEVIAPFVVVIGITMGWSLLNYIVKCVRDAMYDPTRRTRRYHVCSHCMHYELEPVSSDRCPVCGKSWDEPAPAPQPKPMPKPHKESSSFCQWCGYRYPIEERQARGTCPRCGAPNLNIQ